MKNMIDKKKIFVTEISEEDFRKLNLEVFKSERVEEGKAHPFHLVKKNLNQILDAEIEYLLKNGYEEDYKSLITPVTVAIHEQNNDKKQSDYVNVYLDKFMNSYTGAQTYQLGLGIEHLYSNRDYFFCKEDYWRVAKKETKSIYRIHLSEKWLKKFILKHKKEITHYFDDHTPKRVHYVLSYYDLDEKSGEWKLTSQSEVKQFSEQGKSITKYIEEKEELPHDC